MAFFHRNNRRLLAVGAQDSSTLTVFDVTDPTRPILRGSFPQNLMGLHALSLPQGLAFDANGLLAVASYNNPAAVSLVGLVEAQAGVVSDAWVGIGTTSPKAALDVVGDVLIENANRLEVQVNHLELGTGNSASGLHATAIGTSTTASGDYSTALGLGTTASGFSSLAAGHEARAAHPGTFVWADSQSGDFTSTGSNQFLIRAGHGVGIGTNNPQSALHVNGTVIATSFIGDASGLTNFSAAQMTGNEPPAGVTPTLNMVWIKPGTFVMGSPAGEQDRQENEGPQTVVTLTKGFWMGHHEVTQGEFLSLMNSNPSSFTGNLSLPVETVSWFDATNFCWALTQREQVAGRLPVGWGYRLPTEAEWEYCCRALTTTRFYYGDDPSNTSITNYAWFSENSANKTHPVAQKLANAWGLADMSGNVDEWCRDSYGTYPGGSVIDPQGPGSGSDRVLRSGDWFIPAHFGRSALRGGSSPSDRYRYCGFRVALAPGQP